MDTHAAAAPFGTFCNLEHLFHAMAARGLDGIVATQPLNVYYLSRFNGIAHKSDEPRPYAVVISRHAPDHPILVIADYYLSTAAELAVPISDIRPFRAVMMPWTWPRRRATSTVSSTPVRPRARGSKRPAPSTASPWARPWPTPLTTLV